MINELEVDPGGSLSRRWGTSADDVRVKRTIAALEANGISVREITPGRITVVLVDEVLGF
jgi:hypothetical protein